MSMLEKTRLESRVTPQQKQMFVRAAVASGMSLANFVKTALLEKAGNTLRDHDILQLLHPPKAPSGFKELAKWRLQHDRSLIRASSMYRDNNYL